MRLEPQVSLAVINYRVYNTADMGFLGEIGRLRQQQSQRELLVKDSLERTRKSKILADEKAAQNIIKERERLKNIPQGFLKDCSVITDILTQLFQHGYQNYFEEVAKLSGFRLMQNYYANCPEYHLDPADSEIPVNEFYEKASEMGKKQVKAKEEMERVHNRLGWFPLTLMHNTNTKSPDTAFLGHNLDRKTEPKGVAIGILFSKRDRYKEYDLPVRDDGKFESVLDHWDRNVYVRIDSHRMVTITGLDQHQVPLDDLERLDNTLEKAIRKPAKVRIKDVKIYTSGGYYQPR